MTETPETLTLVDGDTGEVIAVDPWHEVPEPNRLVWYRDGRRLDFPEPGAEGVPVVRTLRFARDAKGRTVPVAEATRILLQEFDATGRMVRETTMVRPRP